MLAIDINKGTTDDTIGCIQYSEVIRFVKYRPSELYGRECVTNSDSSVSCKASHGTNHYIFHIFLEKQVKMELNEHL